ncbi:MAG TPA: c-type cytochrome domain-containing protein [Verrucomicrobiae bacterium]|jgi:mono/diheme cytochrome c family protein|nr:c-type cytochrome domain-containing protein [Verrucomicrobiae bacterium]
MLHKGVIIGVALAGILPAFGADLDLSKLPPASSKKDLTYAKEIKPIFEKTCFKCHGEEKQKGKLRLDSLAAVKKGGEDGEVIIVGKSEKSPLVQAIAGLDPDNSMPPEGKGDPLSKEQIGLIRAWIDQGAK